jgi:hypothetical protein
MLPLLERVWNSCYGRIFNAIITLFSWLRHPEIFSPLRQKLFLETARSHSEPNQGNGVDVAFQQSIFGVETA